ncbi:MAG: hypothetical protein ACOYXO_14945 [Chloroflexota bacterium]
MMKGYDTFFEEPGTIVERICRVCGTPCLVERNKLGATSWVAAMAKRETLHDFFYCPHHEQGWHQQALKLVQAIEETPSKRLASLLQLDLIDLLKENGIQPQNEPVSSGSSE